MAGEVKLEVETARQMFMYGDGDGNRIISARELVRRTGLCDETVRKWMKVWQKEMEEALVKTAPIGRQLILSDETEKENRANIDFYADQARQIRYELKNYEEILEKLEGICENFSLNTDNGDKALQYFDTYLRTLGAKSSLRAQLIKIESRWAKISGVEAIQDIAVTTEKEVAKIQGKKRGEDAVKESGGTIKEATPAGFFANRAKKNLATGNVVDESK